MSKSYKLLKDLPDSKAGDVYVLCDDDKEWPPVYYKNGDQNESYWLQSIVENNPEWWEEVKSENKTIDSFQAIGLYSAEQIAYVNSVKDSDLRTHLLHQVRLRDNMEKDRNGFEQLLAKVKKARNDSFQWTDELVLAFARFTNSESQTFQGRYADLDEFKQSNKPQPQKDKQERIEVGFEFMFTYGKHKGGAAYNISSPIIIPEEKLPLIKQAIESVLNDDKGNGLVADILGNPQYAYPPKIYSEKELLDAEEKAFLSSRNGIWSNQLRGAQYPTFSDYKNNI